MSFRHNNTRNTGLLFLIVASIVFVCTTCALAQSSGFVRDTNTVPASTETVIYSFTGGSDAFPYAGLVHDKAGKLYGTTSGAVGYDGNVFQLTPPATSGGVWKETLLYSFTGADGDGPIGGVIFDSAGNLYGTTKFGGPGGPDCPYGSFGCGVVFKLSPPVTGTTWTESVLYTFKGGPDGSLPSASLVFDTQGNLLGTTLFQGASSCKCGTIFELSPPSSGTGNWTKVTLHNFNGVNTDGSTPQASLIAGPNGNLYGTTTMGGPTDSGTVYELVHTATGKWMYRMIYGFTGINDGQNLFGNLTSFGGHLFGTTFYSGDDGNGVGTVFELTPGQAGTWTENTIYTFIPGGTSSGPLGSLAFDKTGNLYGTASSLNGGDPCGEVFKLTNSGGSWTESDLYQFAGTPDSCQSRSSLIFGKGGDLYGTTLLGGVKNAGAVFSVTP